MPHLAPLLDFVRTQAPAEPGAGFVEHVMHAVRREGRPLPATTFESLHALFPRLAWLAFATIMVVAATEGIANSLTPHGLIDHLTQLSGHWLF